MPFTQIAVQNRPATHARFLLATIALPLGAQCWRVLLPTLVWHWGTTLDVHAGLVALFAYLPLLLSLAALRLSPRLRPARALWLAGGGLVLFRLALQAAPSATAGAWAAMLGTAAFLWLLLLLATHARHGDPASWPALALGLVAGLGADTALRGLTGTLDLRWIPGPWPYLPLLALSALLVAALRPLVRSAPGPDPYATGPAWPLLGFGLLLYLHWQLFQNQGWLATLAGWSPLLALAWLTLGNLLALLAAAVTFLIPAPPRSIAAFAGAGLLLATVLAARPGWPAPLGFLLGPPAAAILLTRLRPLTATPGTKAQSSPSPFRHRAAFALWLGLVLFLSLLILYYYSMITPLLPVPRAWLAPLVAAGAAICALFAAAETRPTTPSLPHRPALAAALLLLLAPALVALGDRQPSSVPPEPGYPVRIMTYNIRAAYGLDGRHDVDAVARVVAGSGADVLAVQELSRGWLAHGSSDLLALLADRLAMPYTVLGPAMDPVAGNAILSRYPILASGHGPLPRIGALVGRCYVWARLDLGGGETLLVVNTHLDADDAAIRTGQLAALLPAWPASSRTVLLGDMNAEPGSREIDMILAAGYVDAGPPAGAAAGTTHPDHAARIDWIFHSPDLRARDATILPSRASDHLPVVATIDTRP